MARMDLSQVDKKDRNTWRKWFAYLFNNEAKGANSQAILAVWYAWITAESGKTIYGNNPLNLTCSKGDGCYTGQIGYYRFAGNSRNFVAFESPQAGAKAVIGLLNLSKYRYPPILAAARRDDFYGMMEAISASCWVSCSRPGYGGLGLNNNLIKIANGLRTTVAADIASGIIGQVPGGGTTPTAPPGVDITLPFGSILKKLPGIGNRNVDDGIITAWATIIIDSPQYISLILSALGKGNLLPTDPAWIQMQTELKQAGAAYKGKPVSSLPDSIKVHLSAGATETRPPAVDPLTAIGNTLAGIAAFIAKLFDPQTYVRTGALFLGLILALTGFKMLMDATGGTAPVA